MKKVLLTLVMISVSLGLSAQRLWKISGNGLEKPSYIFGTHHLAPASMADSTAGFAEALAAVDRVYGEVDMSVAMAPAAQMKIASMIMAPADSTLSKVFTAEELAEIDAYLQRAVGPAMTAAMFESYRPIMIDIALEMAMMKRILPDADPTNPLDGHIQQLARAEGKEVGGLETVEFQSALLYGSSIADQASSLLRTVRSGRDPLADSRMLYARYAEGDLDGLMTVMDHASAMTPEEADAMLYNRNSSWVNFLIGILPATSIMIVVGAGHLPGERGVINLLRKAGFSVNPV